MTVKNIIKKSPYWIQKPIKAAYNIVPYEKRLQKKKEFINTYKFLKLSQYWTKEEQEEYQMSQIKKLLEHAYRNVPYYTSVFNERGLKPRDIQNFNDLKQLPYLTKEIVQNNLKDLIAKNYDKRKLEYATTGGSTGIPMGFYMEKKYSDAVEWGFITSQWERVGYDTTKENRCIILRGDIPQKGFYEYKGTNLILSSFKLKHYNVNKYIELIEEFNPDFIQAYPSTISILSEFILENHIKITMNNLKAVLCGSENIYDVQRKNISKAFGARVYSWYGHSEQCCLAGECECSNYYHIFSEYGYTEIINEYGRYVTKENEVGELITTGFNNYVTPFIRYKTGDMAVNTNIKCVCGRNYKLIKKIEGRKQDYFIDKYENKISYIKNDVPLSKIKGKIKAYQYIQNEAGKVILNIENKNKLTDKEINKIKDDFRNFYSDFIIDIKLVDKIQRTKRGKFIYLIQNLKK